ncbi:MAG: dihydroorotase [Candidatus Dormibacteria bacterium]
MKVILRGVRVIDPMARLDASGQDVWLDDGKIVGIYRRIGEGSAPVVDLTPAPGRPPCVLAPGFIDLHTHLREPGPAGVETIATGARAAAAGGFTHLLAMANTEPACDDPDRVAQAMARAEGAAIRVLPVAAVTRGLEGDELVDLRGCAEAGAAAFSDDGRNAIKPRLLVQALEAADEVGRRVLIHPEDEEMIALANRERESVTRCPTRPVAAERAAVQLGLRALNRAAHGRLHLQHVSTAAAVELLRRARDAGDAVSAEATPHHLALWLPFECDPDPVSLRKVNPPLRSEADRAAVVKALREGVIDAVATDHAPHSLTAKNGDYKSAAPGMIGLETALAVCLTLGGMGDGWLPTLVERLTVGPWRILGEAVGVPEPRLRIGEPATCVLFDPAAEWTVGARPGHSLSSNTPFAGQRLRGRVLLTLADGVVAHHDRDALPVPAAAEMIADV